MSIAAAARQSFAAEAADTTPALTLAETTPDVQSAIEKITAWIPTEVVAIYIALLGIFTPDSSGGKWAIFAAGAVLVLVFVILNGLLLNKRAADKWEAEGKPGNPPTFSWSKACGLVVLSGLAYVAWTFALPASPWLDVTDKAPQIGGAAVLVLSLLIPKVAQALDLKLENT